LDRARQDINDNLDLDFDLDFDFGSTDEMKELERVLHSRFGDRKLGTFFDKDLRTFFIIFRGGSLRIISPTRDPGLTLDVDSDAGEIRYVRVNKEGKAESRTLVMEQPRNTV
jgi:hypothetical protein